VPPDERRAEAAAWLSRARDDLRAAKVDLAATPPLLADAAFHCQQASEKAMKGLLVLRSRAVPRTHDLRALGDLVAAIEPDMEPLVDDAAELTEYAWRFRYPGELFEPPLDEVRRSLRTARRVVESVSDREASTFPP
jgi:HEPN domain-containing protein